MKEINYRQALLAFGNYHPDLPIAAQDFSSFKVTPLTGGLINNSYKVESNLSVPFLLQQLNHHVFPRPEDVQWNYIQLSQYTEFEFTGLKMPWPLSYDKQNTLFKDNNGNYWRAFEFIDNSKMYQTASTLEQATATAKVFGKFTAAFDGINSERLKIVIPDFHSLSLRYHQFKEALQTELYERMDIALPLINELKKRERYKHFFEQIINSTDFPKRVMHHDAKIANVLFNNETGEVICPVDFDTAMPGYFFSDLGDMIRSMACNEDENSTNFENLIMRKDFYDAIITGYLSIMDKQLTSVEKKHIHYAGLLIIYMQSLRFITDYLKGDTYYQITYQEQNFNRAKNQLTLLQRLEEMLIERSALPLT